MNGYRFTVERQRLCAWLEDEKAKLGGLPEAQRTQKMLELERTFRERLDGLYHEARPDLEVGRQPR